MRSASCGVVIEPSTSERSYGPFNTAREASGKLAISTSPARASNSSSQSSRLSWHPSQDENFQTASLGFRTILISKLPNRQQILNAIVAKHRAVLADECGTKLAVSAKAESALHIAF